MGRLHLQKAQASPLVTLTALFDTDSQQLADLSAAGLPVVESFPALLSRVDALIIASPTATHAYYAEAALRAQKHVFIEKPAVTSPYELERLLRLEEESGVVTMVGHSERFNPVFSALYPLREKLWQYTFERIAPWTPRGSDASVLLDLLIHDLDLFWAFTEGRIADMRVIAYRTRTEKPDTVQLWVDLVDGRGASFLVSRDAPHKRRRLSAHGPNLWIEADLLSRSVHAWEAGMAKEVSLSTAGDALAAELEHFLSCIARGDTSFLSLAHVQSVMAWAWQAEALAEHRLVFAGQ
jgi:predicted dehydrogenase